MEQLTEEQLRSIVMSIRAVPELDVEKAIKEINKVLAKERRALLFQVKEALGWEKVKIPEIDNLLKEME